MIAAKVSGVNSRNTQVVNNLSTRYSHVGKCRARRGEANRQKSPACSKAEPFGAHGIARLNQYPQSGTRRREVTKYTARLTIMQGSITAIS